MGYIYLLCVAIMFCFGGTCVKLISPYFAKAIPLVSFYMVPIIQSMMAIFAILWGVLFFHESITGYISR